MNHFLLELDTTGPEINIIAPSYTMPNIKTEIRVVSNEPLSKYQDIYIIDSQNNRHNLIFTYADSEFKGEIYLNNISFGIAKIYARLQDEVGNMSNIATFNIRILNEIRLDIEVSYEINNPNIEVTHNMANINQIKAKQDIKPIKSKIDISSIKKPN